MNKICDYVDIDHKQISNLKEKFKIEYHSDYSYYEGALELNNTEPKQGYLIL